ncbi:DUF1992 domain-containing protein [Bacillus sp. 31A1R]|uniref:DUF1992 domain-containing protein n=1 Tax=Robertmurraya mangrovi TaxID=3098077 RepID=A0ABU5J263_9BACI|nr:DUF1992 domain-containing protein [Bacillus sp. 31A1R]MDZ5473518.1 DUF1992 domain-containing protein [Bacillus sp. 31A1R]
MDFSTVISEERIRKAYEDGEFTNLPGLGKPLELEDLSSIPEDLRMAYRMLKNAGFSPGEENKLKQEMMTLEDLISNTEDNEEREGLKKKLNEKLLRFNQMMDKRRGHSHSSMFKNYEQKINSKW